MTDTARIDTLISTLLADRDHHRQTLFFSGMNNYNQPIESLCGTTSCAGGWAIRLFGPQDKTLRQALEAAGHEMFGAYAQELLGLTEEQADFIFYGTLDYSEQEEAVIVALKHLKDHPDATPQELHDAVIDAGGEGSDA